MIHKLIKILLIAIIQIPASVAFAQKYTVRCIVLDTDGMPEIYATCRVYAANDTTKTVGMGTTADNGVFETQLPDAGHYKLYVSNVGKKTIERAFSVDSNHPVADLDTLTSTISDTLLDEVVVAAQKPLISKSIDRIGYDVQADESSKTNSVMEMLRKVPLVIVDGQENIKVKGSSGFKIFKNGRPYNVNPEVLKGIPASMVKRIEVITAPGAKYDAEDVGAIINIVMLESPTVKGVTGNANFRGDSNGMLIPSLSATSQINKVTFSVFGNFINMPEKAATGEGEKNYHYTESGNTFYAKGQEKAHGYGSMFSGEVSYEPDSLNLFTAEFHGAISRYKESSVSFESMTDKTGKPIYSYSLSNIPESERNKYLYLNGSLNYQRNTHRPGETIVAAYLISAIRSNDDEGLQYTDMSNFPLPYTRTFSNMKANFTEHTFQFDYTRPIGKIHTVDVGTKYILRNNSSKSYWNYVDYQTEHTDFSHITNIGALYAQYSAKVKQWSFRAGVRYEYSNLTAKFHDGTADNFSNSFNDIVPSADILWHASETSDFSLHYASTINRPGIEYLNPTVITTPTTLSYGNPDLACARNHSTELTYTFTGRKVTLNATTGFDWANNGIAALNYVDGNGIIRNTYDNINHVRQFSLSTFVQWSPCSKTQLMLNASAGHDAYKQNGMSLKRWKKSVYANLTQKLPWKISGELGVNHTDMGASNVYSYTNMPLKSSIAADVTLRRSFLKEDRLTASLTFYTPMGKSTTTTNQHIVNGDYTGLSSMYQHHARMLQFRIAYRFGALNTSVKKTNKAIENDDMVGGKSSIF